MLKIPYICVIFKGRLMRKFGFVLCAILGLFWSCSEKDVAVTGVSLSLEGFELEVGRDTLIKAQVTPASATDPSVIWYSDNPKVATVEDGLVSAISCGKARITVETVDGEYTAFCIVTVFSSYVPVDSIRLDKSDLKLLIDQTDTLRVTVFPEDATDSIVTWTSSNPQVVIVDDGVITAVGLGDATVTASIDTLTAICAIQVVDPYIAVLPMKAERLPDMLQARADHIIFVAGNQLTVAGGHVNGFTRTTSAEYLEDGEWHTMTMNATHDMGFSVQFADGRMMIGGGCNSNMGVGQSSLVEIYDPQTHSFTSAPSMTTRRTLTHAVEMAGGNVFVSGNWYADDSKELYSASGQAFTNMGSVSEQRSSPYVLRSSADNAIVFGGTSNYGESNALVVDRLEGIPFNVELFESWKPYGASVNWRAADCAIDDYTYLILAKNDQNQVAVIKVEGESFSLLETELPIPVSCDDVNLIYSGQVFTDNEGNTAYLPAYNGSVTAPVYYVLKIDLSSSEAKQTLYKTDILEAYASIWSMTKLPDGRLVACGGIYDSNFTPYSTVWAFSPF